MIRQCGNFWTSSTIQIKKKKAFIHNVIYSQFSTKYSTIANGRNWNVRSQALFTTAATSSSSFHYNRDTGVISFMKSKSDENDKIPLYQTVIGLEIHAQLSIPTKLFSTSPTKHVHSTSQEQQQQQSRLPNTLISNYDIAYPGNLPQLPSYDAIYATLRTCAALQCARINPMSRFERKHYFYADLPHGYQITQQRWPIGTNGCLDLDNELDLLDFTTDDNEKISTTNNLPNVNVGIERIQLEQDSGKTTTVTTPNDEKLSLIDFNRAGSALIEIVFRPDIRSAHQAAMAVTKLQSILRYIKSCDGKMEDGSLRCDLNISIAPFQEESENTDAKNELSNDNDDFDPFHKYLPPGTGNRCEVKNLNSIRQVIAATEYEAIRQAHYRYENENQLDHENHSPKDLEQETRTFDVKTNQTVKIRGKGDAVDYRFMPEPNLPPLILNEQTLKGRTLDQIIDSLPELPNAACKRIMIEYNLSKDVAKILTSDPLFLDLFESSVKEAINNLENDNAHTSADTNFHNIVSSVSNWICNDYLSLINNASSPQQNYNDTSLSITPQQLGQLIAMIHDETVSKKTAKRILIHMHNSYIDPTTCNLNPRDIAEEKGWKIVSDPKILRQLCVEMIQKHTKQLDQYKEGGKKIWKIEKYFAGKVIQASGGNAHPEKMRDILKEVLEAETEKGAEM